MEPERNRKVSYTKPSSQSVIILALNVLITIYQEVEAYLVGRYCLHLLNDETYT